MGDGRRGREERREGRLWSGCKINKIASMTRGTLQKRVWKDCESQVTRKSAGKQSLLEDLNKAMLMDMLMWEEENFKDSRP